MEAPEGRQTLVSPMKRVHFLVGSVQTDNNLILTLFIESTLGFCV